MKKLFIILSITLLPFIAKPQTTDTYCTFFGIMLGFNQWDVSQVMAKTPPFNKWQFGTKILTHEAEGIIVLVYKNIYNDSFVYFYIKKDHGVQLIEISMPLLYIEQVKAEFNSMEDIYDKYLGNLLWLCNENKDNSKHYEIGRA